MDLFQKDELKTLIRRPEGPCVSIYMPTHRAFPDTKQDSIRFKNLLREGEERLKQAGLRSPEACSILRRFTPFLTGGRFMP